MKYFSFDEFEFSLLAQTNGIDNTLTSLQKKNIQEFVDNLLDPLREDWGEYCTIYDLGVPTLQITSGARSKPLNDLLGGSQTSSHLLGYAADIKPYNNHIDSFKNFCIEWLKDKHFDQFISEHQDKEGIPEWIHIGYKRYDGAQRKAFLYSSKDNKYFKL